MPSIPFTRFVDFLNDLSQTKPNPKNTLLARNKLKSWVRKIRDEYDPIPDTTFLSILRLLYPEADVRRKYQLQEYSITKLLSKCLSISETHFKDWSNVEDDGITSHGCLGSKLEEVLTTGNRSTNDPSSCHLSIQEVDDLLSELASKSPYSHESFRSKSTRKREDVLRKLYRDLTPRAACFVTQIILKVMAPVLYPSHGESEHYAIALKSTKKSQHIAPLTVVEFLWAWDPHGDLARLHNTHAALEDLATLARPGSERVLIGSLITLPESYKGHGCSEVIERLRRHGHARVGVETKYDGERCQIHVKCGEDGEPRITIYSKKGRDSTLDRAGIHELVYEALNIQPPKSKSSHRSPTRRAVRRERLEGHFILDAEMVAYNEETEEIDEFWLIKGLVEGTAQGIRGAQYRQNLKTLDNQHSDNENDSEAPCSQDSMCTTYTNTSRHLALVFFDVLMVSSKSLLYTPYHERRATLEQLIRQRRGWVMLSKQWAMDLSRGMDAERRLRRVLAESLARFDEGLVLKPDNGHYVNHYDSEEQKRLGPFWVKLKKDYITGYGDSLDYVALGASWDKERGTALGVKPNVFTTLHMGVLINKEAMEKNPSIKPKFYVYFKASWGLSRDELEDLNFRITSDAVYPEDELSMQERMYEHEQFDQIAPPTVWLRKPLVAEVLGDRFTKDPKCKYYYPRFPRIQKVFPRSERSWKSAEPADEMHDLACKAIGRDRSVKAFKDDVIMFNKDAYVSPKIRTRSETEKRERDWLRKLEMADKVLERDWDHFQSTSDGLRGRKRKRLDSISEESEVDHDSKDDTRGSIQLDQSPSTRSASSRHQATASPIQPLNLNAVATHRASASAPRPLKLTSANIPMRRTPNSPQEAPNSPTKKARTKVKPPSVLKESEALVPPTISRRLKRDTKVMVWPSPQTSPMKPTPKRSPPRPTTQSTSSPSRKDVQPLHLIRPFEADPPMDPPVPEPVRGAEAAPEPPAHQTSAQSLDPLLNPKRLPHSVQAEEHVQPTTRPIIHLPPLKKDELSGIPQLADLLDLSYMWSSPRLDPQLEDTLDAIANIRHRLHARSAFWTGCGWSVASLHGGGAIEGYQPPDWVQSGLIFVDSEGLEKAVFAEIKRMERAGELLAISVRKPVLLLAAGVLDAVKIAGHAEIEVADYVLGVIQ